MNELKIRLWIFLAVKAEKETPTIVYLSVLERNKYISSSGKTNLFSALSSKIIPFFFGLTMQHVGSSFPDQESNLCPLYWKLGVLTTRPPKGVPKIVF